jgi:triosephosphate isomerase
MSGDRKPLISGNWKMNHNHFEAIQTVQKLAYAIEKDDYEACDVSVHPPFTDLRSVQTVLQADNIPVSLGAQNVHQVEKGAFTGEVSAGMLDKLDVKYVIVGHSERRELFGETDEVVNAKATAVLHTGMTPIVCVGETLEERSEGRAQARVTEQLAGSLAGFKPETVEDIVIAYEPIWAIGTGETATPGDAQEMCAHIRLRIAETFGAKAAESVRIQYGGSVKPGNAPELMAQPDIDGALVGGASLDAEDFARIVKYRIYQA